MSAAPAPLLVVELAFDPSQRFDFSPLIGRHVSELTNQLQQAIGQPMLASALALKPNPPARPYWLVFMPTDILVPGVYTINKVVTIPRTNDDPLDSQASLNTPSSLARFWTYVIHASGGDNVAQISLSTFISSVFMPSGGPHVPRIPADLIAAPVGDTITDGEQLVYVHTLLSTWVDRMPLAQIAKSFDTNFLATGRVGHADARPGFLVSKHGHQATPDLAFFPRGFDVDSLPCRRLSQFVAVLGQVKGSGSTLNSEALGQTAYHALLVLQNQPDRARVICFLLTPTLISFVCATRDRTVASGMRVTFTIPVPLPLGERVGSAFDANDVLVHLISTAGSQYIPSVDFPKFPDIRLKRRLYCAVHPHLGLHAPHVYTVTGNPQTVAKVCSDREVIDKEHRFLMALHEETRCQPLKNDHVLLHRAQWQDDVLVSSSGYADGNLPAHIPGILLPRAVCSVLDVKRASAGTAHALPLTGAHFVPLVTGIQRLHKLHPPVVHCDLRPPNWLVFRARVQPMTGPVQYELFITDFGCARRCDAQHARSKPSCSSSSSSCSSARPLPSVPIHSLQGAPRPYYSDALLAFEQRVMEDPTILFAKHLAYRYTTRDDMESFLRALWLLFENREIPLNSDIPAVWQSFWQRELGVPRWQPLRDCVSANPIDYARLQELVRDLGSIVHAAHEPTAHLNGASVPSGSADSTITGSIDAFGGPFARPMATAADSIRVHVVQQ